MNVASMVLERAAERPDAVAIHFASGTGADGRPRHRSVTNAELDADSDAIAHGLAAQGVGRGARTAVLVRPGLDLFTLTLALFKLGAVPVMIDPGLGARRMGRCLAEARPSVFIGVPEAHVARLLLRWGHESVRTCVTVGRRVGWGGTTLDALRETGHARGPFPMTETDDDDVAAILFTSGSTGPPKGVVYRHGNFAAQVEAVRGLGTIADGEIDVPTFPLFALFDPALGMTAVVPEVDPTRPARANPRHVIETAEDFGATNLFGSPALLDTVGSWGSARGVKLSTLRRVISAQSVSSRARVPIVSAGPEIGQGPRLSASVARVSGVPMAKPRRRPARPQNLPRPLRTTTPGVAVSATWPNSGVMSQKLSSMMVRALCPSITSVWDHRRPSGLLGCTSTRTALPASRRLPARRKAASCSL